MTTLPDHIRALREALEAGPTCAPDSRWVAVNGSAVMLDSPRPVWARIASCSRDQDSRFIAAAHPAAILAVLDALEAARLDAERYRWLRDKSVPPHNFYLSVPIEFDGVKYSPAEVDAAIDAALTNTGA